MQMCKPRTHNIVVQIMINNAKLHSIIIYKHEMDMKLYALIFKVEKCITRTHYKIFFTEIRFDYKSKSMIFVQMELEPRFLHFTLFAWNLPYYDIHYHMWNEIKHIHNIVMQKISKCPSFQLKLS